MNQTSFRRLRSRPSATVIVANLPSSTSAVNLTAPCSVPRAAGMASPLIHVRETAVDLWCAALAGSGRFGVLHPGVKVAQGQNTQECRLGYTRNCLGSEATSATATARLHLRLHSR